MAMKFKEDYNLDFFMETSAKTGFNARNIFIEASKVLYKDYIKYKQSDMKKSFISVDSSGNKSLIPSNNMVLGKKIKNSSSSGECKC
jgi:hypothetical protein